MNKESLGWTNFFAACIIAIALLFGVAAAPSGREILTPGGCVAVTLLLALCVVNAAVLLNDYSY